MNWVRAGFMILVVVIVIWAGRTAATASQLSSDGLRAICRIVDDVAATNRLPPSWLARILWQESRFHNEARSPAGAEGIAQFLRSTATEWGLVDPRSTSLAVAAAARMLAELRARFGNLGLAAAAYNAGAGAISGWLRAKRDLPMETRRYVRAVTGRPPEEWVADLAATPVESALFHVSCIKTIKEMA
jgi:soluble lytic murein transglycosylase-like protein